MNNFIYQVAIDLLVIATMISIGTSGIAEVAPMPSVYSEEIAVVLDTAGENRTELEATLSHYESEGDSLKLQAARYFIINMVGHGYATYVLKDTAGQTVDFDVLDYQDYKALRASFDTLEDEHGVLDFERQDMVEDIATITAAFLIDHIDHAFEAWHSKPWAEGLSFELFCQYVLPYRGSNEPLERWRVPFMERYRDVASQLDDLTDPIGVACVINDDIKSWFGFDPRFYYHPTDQGLSEMLTNRLGRCEDMTNVTIYAMRANGLAVTSDYTPHWANTGNNHAWNAIVAPDGRVVPFMGAERNPGKYTLPNKMAKTYRKTYGKQKQNLTFQEKKQEKVPRWLGGKSYVDVTADYVDVCDVAVRFLQDIPDSVDIAYLCVFNSGEWKAIHWGRIEDSAAVFTDMGRDIAYLPALYLNEEIVPFGNPFILDTECGMLELSQAESETTSVKLVSTTRRKQETSTDGIAKTFLTAGQEYELFFWDDDWQSIGKSVAGEGPLIFNDVPTGCLYWLVETDSDREERIFTIEDGGQVWW